MIDTSLIVMCCFNLPWWAWEYQWRGLAIPH